MNKDNQTKQQKKPTDKKLTHPGCIKGKISVSDKRERKDGPGGD